MRIAGILSVKDEIELIDAAVAQLRGIGVDHIIACDMGSTDGTYEALLKYRSDSAFWVTRLSDATPDHFETWSRVCVALARSARVDWMLCVDADEFWLPQHGTLRDVDGLMDADILHVGRYNMPVGPDGGMFTTPTKPADYAKIPLLREPPAGAAPTEAAGLPWIMAKPEDKMMVRPELVAAIGLGAHDIIPRAGMPLRRMVPKDLLVAHVPITTPARFTRKIDNIRKIFNVHDRAFGEAVAFHWRRWLVLRETGKLDAELQASLFTQAMLKTLRAEGRLATAAEIFASLQAAPAADAG